MSATWDSKPTQTSPVLADEVLIIDTTDSRNQKRSTISEILSLASPGYWDNVVTVPGPAIPNSTTTLAEFLRIPVPEIGSYQVEMRIKGVMTLADIGYTFNFSTTGTFNAASRWGSTITQPFGDGLFGVDSGYPVSSQLSNIFYFQGWFAATVVGDLVLKFAQLNTNPTESIIIQQGSSVAIKKVSEIT